MSEARRVNPGDIVTLKSGGPMMTVENAQPQSVRCVWFSTHGDLMRSDFVPESLRYREQRNLEVSG